MRSSPPVGRRPAAWAASGYSSGPSSRDFAQLTSASSRAVSAYGRGGPAGAPPARRRRLGRASPDARTSASRGRRSARRVGRVRRWSVACWRISRHAVRWNVPALTSLPMPEAQSRSESSSAALRENVQTRTCEGWASPSRARRNTRRVRTRVLPAPAPASTHKIASSDVTTSRWLGVRPASGVALLDGTGRVGCGTGADTTEGPRRRRRGGRCRVGPGGAG